MDMLGAISNRTIALTTLMLLLTIAPTLFPAASASPPPHAPLSPTTPVSSATAASAPSPNGVLNKQSQLIASSGSSHPLDSSTPGGGIAYAFYSNSSGVLDEMQPVEGAASAQFLRAQYGVTPATTSTNEIYRTAHWIWFSDPTIYQQNKAAIDSYLDWPEQCYGQIMAWLQVDPGPGSFDGGRRGIFIDSSPGLFAWSGGGNIGIGYQTFSVVPDWPDVVIPHEMTNMFTGSVTGDWPYDWWADGRSPFPAMVAVQVEQYLGHSYWQQHDNGDSQDTVYVMFRDALQKVYGWGIFQSTFAAMEADHVDLSLINPEYSSTDWLSLHYLRSHTVAYYLSQAAGTDLSTVLDNSTVGEWPPLGWNGCCNPGGNNFYPYSINLTSVVPVVHVQSPPDNQSNIITLTANATDPDWAVKSVTFFWSTDNQNFNLIATDTNGTDGWSTSWDTATAVPGKHTAWVAAIATDMSNFNSTRSTSTPFTVDNQGPGSEYYLTVQGTVGGSVEPLSGWHSDGAQVNITATPNLGYLFQSWTGAGLGSYTGNSATAQVTVNSNVTETANFYAPTGLAITVNSTPLSGADYVTIDGTNVTTPDTESWDGATNHTLTALHITSCGDGCQYIFQSWTAPSFGTIEFTNFTYTAPATDEEVTANYQQQYMLTTSADVGGIVNPESGWQNAGASIELSAISNGTYIFGAWTGSGDGSYIGTDDPTAVTMNGPITETASFAPACSTTSTPEPPQGFTLRQWDDFSGSSLDPFWTVVNGANGNSVAVGANCLSISAASQNGIGWGASGAPLVLSANATADNFDFQAKSSWDGTVSAFRSFGIIAYSDENDWLSVEIAPEGVASAIWMIGGSLNVAQVSASPNPVVLRLTRIGNMYTFYYSTDGNTWTQVWSGHYASQPVQLGLYARSWGLPVSAAFDWAAIFTQRSTLVVCSSNSTPPPTPQDFTTLRWDDFDGSGLNSFWVVVNGTNGNAVSESAGCLSVSVAGGNDLGGNASSAPVVLSANPINGTFDFRTRASWDGTTSAFRGFGIIAYQDTGNWVSIELDPEGRMMLLWTAGGAASSITVAGGATYPVYLRILRTGNSYYFYYSLDGVEWLQVYSGTWTFSNTRLGMYARSWGLPLTVSFDWAIIFTSNSPLATCSQPPPTAPANYALMKGDNFTGSSLDPFWTVLNGTNGNSVAVSAGCLNVADAGGNDIEWGTSGAPLVLSSKPINGNFDFQVKSSWDGNTTAFRGFGVIAYQDVNNWVGLETDPEGRMMAVWTIDGATDSFQVSGATSLVYMRMVRSDNTYTLYYSSDGAAWSQLYSSTLALTNTRLGMYARSWGEPLTVSFDWAAIFVPPVPSVTLTVSYRISGGGSNYSAPVFNYTQVGLSKNYTLTPTPTKIKIDSHTAWTYSPAVLTGSTGSERWIDGWILAHGNCDPHYPTVCIPPPPPDLNCGDVPYGYFIALRDPPHRDPHGFDGDEDGIACEDNTMMVFSYQHQYYLTMLSGTVGSVSPLSGWQNAGGSVQIQATANYGYVFGSWTGTGSGSYTGTANPAQLTMNAPISEIASFKPKVVSITITSSITGSGYVTVDGTPIATPHAYSWNFGDVHSITAASSVACAAGCQYAFASWSDGGTQSHTITVSLTTTTYTASFQRQYMLTIHSTGGTTSPSSGWINAGAKQAVQATADSGYSFTGWIGLGSGSYTGPNNPATVTMNGPMTETANFIKAVTVTVTSNPAGPGFIFVDGSAVVTPHNFTWLVGSSHLLTANSMANCGYGCQYTWQSWSDGGAPTHLVVVSTSTTYTVNYQMKYQLTMFIVPGGSGTTTPSSGISWQKAGSQVTLTATPNKLYQFQSWSGSGVGGYTGTVNPSTVTMNGPITEVATFAAIPTSRVTITSTPTAGSGFITVDGTPVSTPTTFTWIVGSTHTITASNGTVPYGYGTRYMWQSWGDGGARSHTVTIGSAAATYTAIFQPQYYLTMTAGAGGTVTPTSGWYVKGASVQIAATPNSSYMLYLWSGSGSGSYTGTANPTTVTMNGPITETATFNTIKLIQITVTSYPTGSGYATVDGVTITTQQTFTWAAGSTHAISANSPMSCGTGCQYVFVSWSDKGAQTHKITAPSYPTTYTATYKQQYYVTIAAIIDGQPCSSCSHGGWYDAGTKLPLTANPAPGYRFTKWVGTGSGSYTGTAQAITITILAPITETAYFAHN